MTDSPELRPGVTVVIPVKDRADLLGHTLRSVGRQSLQAKEIIVVDDGSVDDSPDVARQHGATVISTGPQGAGPSAARNRGLARVSTEFACPLDSDDLLLPSALERLSSALTSEPAAPFAFGQALEAARDGTGWHPTGVIAPGPRELGNLPCSIYARNFVPSSAVIGRTRELRAGGYPLSLTFNEDHYLWLVLAGRGLPSHVPEVLAVSRRHEGSRHEPLAYSDVDDITKLSDHDPRFRPCRPARLGVQLVTMGTDAVQRGRPGEAARVAWKFLLTQSERRGILRSAVEHWRIRRDSPRRAQQLWHTEPALRRFLSSYG
jgi:glycosyltransferase involved in cell wall biosynthesis